MASHFYSSNGREALAEEGGVVLGAIFVQAGEVLGKDVVAPAEAEEGDGDVVNVLEIEAALALVDVEVVAEVGWVVGPMHQRIVVVNGMVPVIEDGSVGSAVDDVVGAVKRVAELDAIWVDKHVLTPVVKRDGKQGQRGGNEDNPDSKARVVMAKEVYCGKVRPHAER